METGCGQQTIKQTPHSRPYPHSRESGNLPINWCGAGNARAASLCNLRRWRGNREIPAFAGMGSSFNFVVRSLFYSRFRPFLPYPHSSHIPIPPTSPFPPYPYSPPYPHSRESGNLPINWCGAGNARAASLCNLRRWRGNREIPAFAGMGSSFNFVVHPLVYSRFRPFPPHPHSLHIPIPPISSFPPISLFPPYPHSRESGNLPINWCGASNARTAPLF